MRRSRALGMAIALVCVSGCAEPPFDASSDDAFQTSLERVRATLSDADRAALTEAMDFLMKPDDSPWGSPDQPPARDPVHARRLMSGKTAAEVIAVARQLRAERDARDRALAARELRWLERDLKTAEETRSEFERFQVATVRYVRVDGGLVVAAVVKNGTTHPVGGVQLAVRLMSPGRTESWVHGTVNARSQGGIPPGKEGVVRGPLAAPDGWHTSVPRDASMKATVTQLQGEDGSLLFPEIAGAEKTAARAAVLRKFLGR